MTVKRTHYLLVDDTTLALDVPGSVLSLMSRGRYPLAGDVGRPERDELAGLLGGGMLAELLRSGEPIVVDSVASGYRIEHV